MPQRVTILCIDDNPLILRCCRDVYAEEGFTTVEAGTGAEGVEKMGNGHFDVIVTDLKMPGMDGMEVVRAAQEKEPGAPVIVLTGYPSVPTAIESVRAGAFDYVCKPITPDELVLVTRKALDHRRLLLQSRYFRRRAGEEFGIENVIAGSEAMAGVLNQIRQVAPTDSTALLLGESGTGKEVVARAIHACSARKQAQFIVADCASLAPSVFESELFGHVRGAFTGATSAKPGLFEVAHGGTLFLDEIGNVPEEIQVKLLRVLDKHEFKPVGGTASRAADVRLIAATNRDLKGMVDDGSFREDLYYRLNVFPITLPPLRERPEDIPLFANHFLEFFAGRAGKQIDNFSPEAMQILLSQSWPGNVRELRNVVERIVILTEGPTVESLYLPAEESGDLAQAPAPVPHDCKALREMKQKAQERIAAQMERSFLLSALERNAWNVTQAAADTGMQRTYFQALMRKRDVRPPPR